MKACELYRCDYCGVSTPLLLSARWRADARMTWETQEICLKCFVGWCQDYHVPVFTLLPRLCNDPDHV